MFGSSKPTASLSSGLLARKGQARPAMRPQGFVGLTPTTSYEDLGWNDMGDDATPAPAPAPASPPEVLRQRAALDERLTAAAPAEAAPEPEQAADPVEPMAAAPAAIEQVAIEQVTQAVAARPGKAAFTLRLDRERHLRLRLASAVTHRSAQQLVIEALDAFLQSRPEVEALVRQVDPAKKHG